MIHLVGDNGLNVCNGEKPEAGPQYLLRVVEMLGETTLHGLCQNCAKRSGLQWT